MELRATAHSFTSKSYVWSSVYLDICNVYNFEKNKIYKCDFSTFTLQVSLNSKYWLDKGKTSFKCAILAWRVTWNYANNPFKIAKYLGLSSSTGSSEASDILDTAITNMIKLSNNFFVTNQWIICLILKYTKGSMITLCSTQFAYFRVHWKFREQSFLADLLTGKFKEFSIFSF